MADTTKNLEESWKRRTEASRAKALNAVRQLEAENEPVNFNSVHLRSGVSKHYLYKDQDVRSRIEESRKNEEARKIAWHSKYDKTSKSKDVIIEAKDKRIAKLEAENKQLRHELEMLRALVYEQK